MSYFRVPVAEPSEAFKILGALNVEGITEFVDAGGNVLKCLLATCKTVSHKLPDYLNLERLKFKMDDGEISSGSDWSVSDSDLLELGLLSESDVQVNPPGETSGLHDVQNDTTVDNTNEVHVEDTVDISVANSDSNTEPSSSVGRGQKRKFKFHDRRLKTEALTLEDKDFKPIFRMSKDTFFKLYEEFWDYFPQGKVKDLTG